MPRARNIKPGFFENEFIGSQIGDIQILFIGLWTQADREGVIELRLPKIRKAIFGFRPDVTDDVLNGYLTVIERLDNGEMLVRARHENKDYLVVKNFMQHQSPHHTEKKGKLPALKVLLEAKNDDLTVKPRLEHRELPCHNALNPESGILNEESGIRNPVRNDDDSKNIKKNLIDDDFRKKNFDVDYYLSDDDRMVENVCAPGWDKALLRQSFNDWIKKPGQKIPQQPVKAYLAWLQKTKKGKSP